MIIKKDENYFENQKIFDMVNTNFIVDYNMFLPKIITRRYSESLARNYGILPV